ncbi:hypothetical protein C1X59_08205 [Pseudomonas sp. FW215-R2]|jgi:hypothetical protein|uniref:DUF4365 domain-containing protein n=1 Tax=unclassified Pseudomonas TaxID=196821 RepID=UPI000C88EFAD|nr:MULTISPECIES: DUF4365 domain-containing protein [unclassified Pseudomonas]PMX02304.1 hypothetical protein C1X59_08205 [Pseudomonas sp. FW215-R2]PMX10990.1 hypothetical protein C1X60_07495 [Pseudomonas sp. FW215-L1]PMX20824.1 hypothetical protein C1X57_20065 [Pseudomonas sp. FW215-E1]PNA25491.1 hypothetical protein C1X58_22265 [Pseudomonas sp. FW215-R4]
MSTRSPSQKIGARGHKWLASHVEESLHWLSRDLGEDYGIDMEFELHEGEVQGNILKVQIKSEDQCKQKNGLVKIVIDRKYLRYADACRYPVLLVFVCLATKQAWYIWLQQWLLEQRAEIDPLAMVNKTWTVWVPVTQTVQAGLQGELKGIARWEGQTQLTLTLSDAIRCARAVNKNEIAEAVQPLLGTSSSQGGVISLNTLIAEAVALGDKLRNTRDGNRVVEQIYNVIRHFGNVVTKETALKLVMRGESFSRAGVNSIGVLYEHHFEHARSLELSKVFEEIAPQVAFYCAFRESSPQASSFPSKDFRFAGLKYIAPEDEMGRFINRGTSFVLDCLVWE